METCICLKMFYMNGIFCAESEAEKTKHQGRTICTMNIMIIVYSVQIIVKTQQSE